MASTEATVAMSKLASHLTMNVTVMGVRLYTWRFAVAMRLMRLAAWVAGTDIQVETQVNR